MALLYCFTLFCALILVNYNSFTFLAALESYYSVPDINLLQRTLAVSENSISCSAFEHDAEHFFEVENNVITQRRRTEYLAAYNYNTNVTEENRLAMIAIAADNAVWKQQLAERIKQHGYENVQNKTIRRQANLLARLGNEVLHKKDYEKLQNAISSMQTNYATATVCSYTNASNCLLTLEPHIQERLAHSRDPKELEHYWVAWHDKAGTPMRKNFSQYVELTAKASHMINYTSYADLWISFYDDPHFERNLDATYRAILPLYKEIHGYVRYHLRKFYGDNIVSEMGPIPMHLLGNMWAQQWHEAMELYTPYPSKPFVDVTAELKSQQYTVQKMFQLGDDFFKSLNMRALPASFWNLSVLERPTDREIVCHASAWDLLTNSDVRIKMCTEVDNQYFYVLHHELGHIQYYLQYEQQPFIFRAAPNPGFHEAVGDAIALSVTSLKHLKAIGLSPVGTLDEQSRINELFKNALKKIVFLPFAYTMDKYRYAVFRGDIDEATWNCGFWQMRSEFSGVEPPVTRTDRDFDPTAKYHIDSDVEYLRYFAAHIFQFQFHKAMCIKAGQYVPSDPNLTLDNCDIYGSKEAGAAFSKLLAQGNSKNWKDVLEEFTGETEMNPSALLEYFEPLQKWLKAENRRLGVPLGWLDTNKVAPNCCPPFST